MIHRGMKMVPQIVQSGRASKLREARVVKGLVQTARNSLRRREAALRSKRLTIFGKTTRREQSTKWTCLKLATAVAGVVAAARDHDGLTTECERSSESS